MLISISNFKHRKAVLPGTKKSACLLLIEFELGFSARRHKEVIVPNFMYIIELKFKQ